MTRDYRQASPTRPAPRRAHCRSCLWSFLLGGMLGAFGVGLLWTLNPDALRSTPAPLPPKVERPAPEPPSFQFPDLLRDTEVEIGGTVPRPTPRPIAQPTPVGAPAADPAPLPAAATTADGRGFMVQVASFKRGADAERLKAELALLGLASRVEVATIPERGTFHRVRIGPYPDQQSVEQVRAFLKQHGKDSATIPLR